METEEQILSRHRKEDRDLVATVTGLKKQAPKSKRKEVNKRCAEMEQNLKEKHAQELKAFKSANGDGDEEEDDDELTPEKLLAQLELDQKETVPVEKPKETDVTQQKGPKRNRQKERLAKRQAQIEEERRKAEEEAALQPDYKKIEEEDIAQLCQFQGVTPFDIKPDGNCLFASIADQLKTRQNIDVSIQELRTKACNHIRADPNTFIPYLFDEETMSLKDINEYTKTMESTAAWGSDLEILALSKEYDCPISVMMTGRSTLKINEDGNGEELKLVYYKHSYALGEHYNSLRDA
ncbi:CYFA0S01e08790g1_1 [Cyberlindnera fabianii]|uniref:CYFA0S01e08790g1_1 n=1 Tax=Cyberlindnera fabianii TaxID=36022 RepID=A0A061AI45_CYBFA|nr:OTU domain-containing protein 2 [Cyberlindnera fabianii]CDR37238.1 CYFA0S01e08790g1_1 [Cyberlindnera fabianii]